MIIKLSSTKFSRIALTKSVAIDCSERDIKVGDLFCFCPPPVLQTSLVAPKYLIFGPWRSLILVIIKCRHRYKMHSKKIAGKLIIKCRSFYLEFASKLFFNATYLETTCKQSKLPAILGKFACKVPRNCSVTLLEFYLQKKF